MSILNNQEALEVLKSPSNQKEISKARKKKLKTQLHTETILDADEYTTAHRDLLSWIENDILKDSDTFNQMKGVIQSPFPSNELTESIFNQGTKIFKSEDRYIKFNFTNPELEVDAENYRKKIADDTFWKTEGYNTYKSAIDSIVVVDLPALEKDEFGNFISNTENPEPYYFILDVDLLHSVHFSKVKVRNDEATNLISSFKIEHIAYKTKNDDFVVIDDLSYRLFSKESGAFSLVSESPHNLGYCPAQSFWSTPLNRNTRLRKSNQITRSQSELNWYCFYTWAAKYLKLYAPFPIYAGYKPVCNYKQSHEGRPDTVCKDGVHQYKGSNGEVIRKKCPKCSGVGKPGPGKFLQVKAPQDPKEDPDLLKNPIVVIPAEKVSVDTVNEEVKNVEAKIWSNCVGAGDEVLGKEDVNEKQVKFISDNKAVINYMIKVNFEVIHKFAMDTVFSLRYGDSYLGSVFNYGDDYLPDEEIKVVESYKMAKDSGLPNYDLQSRRDTLNKTKHKNNPDALERIKILENLEPFPDMSWDEFSDFTNKNPSLVSKTEIVLKAGFNSFISRFEREVGNILTHGNLLTFDRKISDILDVIRGYASESIGEEDGADIDTPIDIEAEQRPS